MLRKITGISRAQVFGTYVQWRSATLKLHLKVFESAVVSTVLYSPKSCPLHNKLLHRVNNV